jgi:Type IX secretion system protein PorV
MKLSVVGGVALSLFCAKESFGQDLNITDVQLNTITTAVPFLLIGPDSRSSGIGDAGVSISPDANSMHWNASKLAFVEDQMQISVSYSPWLRNLVPDMSQAYLSGYYKINKTSTLGLSLRYFNLGEINFTNNTGELIRNFTPKEFSLDAAYALKLSDNLSGAITGRFINSNLTGGVSNSGATSKPGRAFAVDLSAFYKSNEFRISDKDATLSAGINISNIGNKMSYTNSQERDFIPINLRLGPALTVEFDEFNKLTTTVDFNKLLVPTPAKYDPTDITTVIAGKDPNVGIAEGIFGSFSDAPGEVISLDTIKNVATIKEGSILKEELREINISGGLEYWYDNQFAIRAGYFHEHSTKGNRKYATFGVGLKYNVFALDFSYLISTTGRQNPLANTLRFSLKFTFEDSKKSKPANTDAD